MDQSHYQRQFKRNRTEDNSQQESIDFTEISFTKDDNPTKADLTYWNYYLSNKDYKNIALCRLCKEKGIIKTVSTTSGSTSGLF